MLIRNQMEDTVKTNGLMRKPICDLTLQEMQVLADHMENPALFFNGRSSVLARNNVPTNGFKLEDIPTPGKLAIALMTKNGNGKKGDNKFAAKAVSTPMGHALIWPLIKSRLDMNQVVNVDTNTGVVTAFEQG